MDDWLILGVSLAYLGSLFVIAWYGERAVRGGSGRRTPLVYSLSLAIYCTSWTFYGAVGQAASAGFDFWAIYVGPIVMVGLGWPLLARIVTVARTENVVSVSDFIAARYGKSRNLAALVTVTAIIGLLPYLALQLKAITISFEVLTSARGAERLPGGTTLAVTVAMAVFAILFGVRGINANEHHRGLMLAIATESVVKLAAALAVGIAITVFAFGSPSGLGEAVAALPELERLLDFDGSRPEWWAACLLSALAILCLPRQFHVAVVENTHIGDIRKAARLFPAYLIAINLFVLPVALAGLVLVPGGAAVADTFMVSIPLHLDWNWLALFAFIGGLSAATGMIIVETLALGTMVSNDLVVPLLVSLRSGRTRWVRDPGPLLLAVRRSAVVVILALAYGCYLAIGAAFPLRTLGLISFAAVAQFAPALLIGLFWKRANGVGAFAGILVGFLVWLYTMLLPSFAIAGWIPWDALAAGPFGLAYLSPVGLAGIEGLDPLTHGVLWSLGLNLAAFTAGSLLTEPSSAETQQAERFVALRGRAEEWRGFARTATLADLHELAARYVGKERADAVFGELVVLRQGAIISFESALLVRADAEAIQATERLLAGIVGSASARVVVASAVSDGRFSRNEARSIIGEASRAILAQHELLVATLENVRQGICAFDSEFRVALWNRRFLELLDVPEGMIRVGTSLEEIVRYNESRGEYGREGEFETLLGRRSDPARQGKPDVYERRRPDGTVLEIATNPMPGGGFVAVYTDVTERHRAAAALREANESLERRIAERTLALSEAKAEAERANQSKTRFLAAAGHDLLQPLHAARLFLSVLSERVSDPAIGQIDASLHSVEHLLGELMEVSKLDSGVMKPQPRVFPIDELLRPLGEEFALVARQHGLAFRRVRCAATVRSDPALLRRILQNFLANAVRYTESGRILFGCRRRDGHLSIEVWDTGPGIPEDKLRDIFVEFRQLDPGNADRSKGLGLGLAIVERLAGILGHAVSVRSRVGKGSGFAVQVPLSAEPASAQPLPTAKARIGHFDGALVLCIENEPAIAQATRDLLSAWSCEVVTGATPEEALDRLGTRRPDLILTDYHLDRGRTGIDALAVLRPHYGETIPTAVITADRSPSVRAAAAEAGCRLLYKPIRPGALRALVSQLLAEGRRMAG